MPDISVQNLLLGLGTALVAVAAIVFTAVNWSRLGATFQGLLLVALTAVAGVATWACGRKRLPATAEALGLVTVMLAIADAHALHIGFLPDIGNEPYWAGALAGVAAGAFALGRGVGIRSTRVAAGILGQLPLLELVSESGLSGAAQRGLVLVQVAIVLVLAARPVGVRLARQSAAALATCMWSTLVIGALLECALGDTAATRGHVVVLFGAAAIAALASWLRAETDEIRSVAVAVASMLSLLATGIGLATVVEPGQAVAWTGLLAAVGLVVALRSPVRWGGPPSVIAGVATLASVSALGIAVMTATSWAFDVLSHPWAGSLTVRAADVGARPVSFDTVAVLIELATATVLVGAARLAAKRTVSVAGAVAVSIAAVVTAPILLPLSVGGMVAVTLGAAALAVLAAILPSAPAAAIHGGPLAGPIGRHRLEAGAATAGVLLAIAGAWASASASSTLVAIGVAAALALLLAVAARSVGSEVIAVTASGLVVAAAGAAAGLGFAATGVAAAPAWAAATAAASVLGLAGVLLAGPDGDPSGVDGMIVRALETTAWTIHGVALFAVCALADPGALRIVLSVGVLAAGLHAARPGRGLLVWPAAGQAMVLAWLELGQAGVQAPEPYVVPLAAILLAAGLASAKKARSTGTELPSWIWMGPALVTAIIPSLVISLGDPGLVRPLLLLAVGAAVLATGALAAKRAPVDVGATVVTVIGLRQLAPVVGTMPNWATLGATGLVLLAIGATFEQRRRDLTGVRHHYRSFT
ncbi:MAG: putative integral rane protein [Acidimicrobiales bacterium]|nr:putative integral rane protein [Acidimicrobiales bacterium]